MKNVLKNLILYEKYFISYPLTHHPDASKPFILHTDASNEGFGASLSQLDENGNERPCSYISRSLNPAEKN